MSQGLGVFDLMREYLPGESDEFLDYVLWTHTGFPSFWTGDPVQCLRSQVAAVADKLTRCATLRDDMEQYVYVHGAMPPDDEDEEDEEYD